MSKTWFITGTSRGFGRLWALAALERGDKVTLTARDKDSTADIVKKFPDTALALKLDVNDREAVFSAVNEAYEHFNGLDVVVNNAGYGLFGAAEEVTEKQARNQFDTNFFGALWVTQASLPHLRKQNSGHIIQISSIAGIIAAPSLGLYHASKWALEGLSQALAAEVKPLGINVTIIEPTGYSTDWSGDSGVWAPAINDYDAARAFLSDVFEKQAKGEGIVGKPEATSAVLLKIVDSNDPPLRVHFGDGILQLFDNEYQQRLDNWKKVNPLAIEAFG